MADIDKRCIFAISHAGTGDNIPVLVVGIPEECYDVLRSGLTQTMDLTMVGLPIKLVLFGGKDHTECKRLLDLSAAANGETVLDERRRDFSIKGFEPKGE